MSHLLFQDGTCISKKKKILGWKQKKDPYMHYELKSCLKYENVYQDDESTDMQNVIT